MRRLIVGLAILVMAGVAPTGASADKQQDQQIAKHIFEKLTVLKEQGKLRGFDIRMRVSQGNVWLIGEISSEAQRKLVLETASQSSHLGTRRVVNNIKLRGQQTAVAPKSVQEPKPRVAKVPSRPRVVVIPNAKPHVAKKSQPAPSERAEVSQELKKGIKIAPAQNEPATAHAPKPNETNSSVKKSLPANLGFSSHNPLRNTSVAVAKEPPGNQTPQQPSNQSGGTFKSQGVYRHPNSRRDASPAISAPQSKKAGEPPMSSRRVPVLAAQPPAAAAPAPAPAKKKLPATPRIAIEQPAPRAPAQPAPTVKKLLGPADVSNLRPEPRVAAQPTPAIEKLPAAANSVEVRPDVLVAPQAQPQQAQPQQAQPQQAQPQQAQPRTAQPRTAQPRTVQPQPAAPAQPRVIIRSLGTDNTQPLGTGVEQPEQPQPERAQPVRPRRARLTLPQPAAAPRGQAHRSAAAPGQPAPLGGPTGPRTVMMPMQLPPHVLQQLMAQRQYMAQRQLNQVPLAFAPAQGASYNGHMQPGANGQPMGSMPAHLPGSGTAVMPAQHDNPSMPGYAWASYAPHPNYAALTYPKQYSPMAWPYIGPYYPYPQVPLGWRRVVLEWKDGWWSLDFKGR